IPEKISQLIYVAAFFPVDGESLFEIARSMNPGSEPPGMQVDPSGMTISLDLSKIGNLFFNCCSKKIQEEAMRYMCPEPLMPMMAKVSLRKEFFGKLPKRYVECSKDHAVPLEAQKKMCKRQACHVVSLPTDHCPNFSMPDQLCDLLSLP